METLWKRRTDRPCGILSSACLAAVSLGAAQGLPALKPGEWFEAPGSHLESVTPRPAPFGDVASVMSAWSGGAYDSKRDRLMVWGGGHSDYAGNEMYAFDLESLKWSRLTDPSADVGGVESSGIYPDGNPRSRHTYNYVQYVSAIDRFCTFGGAGMYPSGQVGTAKTHCFDPSARNWEQKSDAIGAYIGSLSAEDPATGLIWMHGAGEQAKFASWDPRADRWTRHSDYDGGWFDYYFTAAVGAGKFVAVGDGKVIVWDLQNPSRQPVEPALSGSKEIIEAGNPGLAYDPLRGRFAAWAGGKDIYYLDPATWAWSKAPVAPGNAVTPTKAEARGTYGRFRYVPSRDLYIVVNRIDENVFVFRPSAPTTILPRERGGRFAFAAFPAGLTGMAGMAGITGEDGRFLWRAGSRGGFRSVNGRRLADANSGKGRP